MRPPLAPTASPPAFPCRRCLAPRLTAGGCRGLETLRCRIRCGPWAAQDASKQGGHGWQTHARTRTPSGISGERSRWCAEACVRAGASRLAGGRLEPLSHAATGRPLAASAPCPANGALAPATPPPLHLSLAGAPLPPHIPTSTWGSEGRAAACQASSISLARKQARTNQ